MARLRKVIPSDTEDSGDSLPDLEVILSKHKTRNTGQTAKSTETNGSVAKNASQKGNESSLRDNTQKSKEGPGDRERSLACFIPKAQVADKPAKKQRVLKPMAWNDTLLQKMPASELFMPEKPKRTRKDANPSVFTGLLARIPAKIASADGNKREELEEEEDVEESLWCGSDVTAGEESDAMIQNSVKKETTRQDSGTTRSTLQSEKDTEPRLEEHEQHSRSTSQQIQDVIDLTTTPEPIKSSKRLKKIVESTVPPPNVARPRSSLGNGHQAIHQ